MLSFRMGCALKLLFLSILLSRNNTIQLHLVMDFAGIQVLTAYGVVLSCKLVFLCKNFNILKFFKIMLKKIYL